MVMNKILFFTLSLVMAITAYGQNSASVDTLQTASDSTSSRFTCGILCCKARKQCDKG